MIASFSKVVTLVATIFFLSLSALAQMRQDTMHQHSNRSVPRTSITMHQEVDFKASPERLYKPLLDSKQFSEFTAQSGGFSAMSAKIDPSEGGAFTLFDGYITGRNLSGGRNQDIVNNKKTKR